ncbi:MAG: aminopeptidase P family protein [Deltaproteobacteria bacterium]|nr:aminopeptidase P family protein [Candidatus Zymogenaceae bacterium]
MNTSSPFITPRVELTARAEHLAKKARDRDIDVVLIFQNTDLFYFTGTIQKGVFVLTVESPSESTLFVIRDIQRAKDESTLPNIREMDGMRSLPRILSDMGIGDDTHIGLEMDVLPAKQYLSVKKMFPNADISDASPLIRDVRSVKSPFEIELTARAAAMQRRVFAEAFKFFTPDIREIDIMLRIEARYRELGHQGLIRMRGFNQELFYGVVSSGASGDNPNYLDGPVAGAGLYPSFPQGGGTRVIGIHEPVMVDMVSNVGGYISDAARMYCKGAFPNGASRALDAAVSAQEAVLPYMHPGGSVSAGAEAARHAADASGLGMRFMGPPGRGVSFVGHGVGLEVDELPVIIEGTNDTFREGQIVALEPKFFLEDHGVVGLENTYVIGPDGPEKLTDFPEEPVIVD